MSNTAESRNFVEEMAEIQKDKESDDGFWVPGKAELGDIYSEYYIAGGNVHYYEMMDGLIEDLLSVLPPKMKECGLSFGIASGRSIFPNAGFITTPEFDMILQNDTEIMVIDVLQYMNVKDVQFFLRNMKDLREKEVESGLINKTVYAGLLCCYFTDEVRACAADLGIYLIEADSVWERGQKESALLLNVFPPPIEKIGKW